MSFRQIVSLAGLMLEQDNENIPNILTIRDIAKFGLDKQVSLSNTVGL